MEHTLLSSFLKQLNVKFNKKFTNTYFMQHPHKYNLYGMSRMLLDYKVPNNGVRIKNKELSKLDPPFIAQAGGELVMVKDITDNEVGCIWNGQTIYLQTDYFKEIWSGVILVAESSKDSIEPDYEKHYKEDFLNNLQRILIGVLVGGGILMLGWKQQIWNSPGMTLSILINCIGIYISFLLLLKQMHIESHYADKICSLFQQKDCSNILESEAAKLAGVFSWSEIGLAYFISNLIFILFCPQYMGLYVLINICSLPYSLWSIWYQYKIAREWCILCVIIQILLWMLFGTNILFIQIAEIKTIFFVLFLVGFIYLLPFLIINRIVKVHNRANLLESVVEELNSLKGKEEVFLAQLKKQKYCEVDESVSNIFFGNRQASLRITIFTNPHCAPCAIMHKRVKKLMEQYRDQLSIQYIFSAFDDDLLITNKLLIGIYQNREEKDTETIFSKWFSDIRQNTEEYIDKYQVNTNDPDIFHELFKHEKWKKDNQLMATPTIFVNGYELPSNYKIEDLVHFTTLKIN